MSFAIFKGETSVKQLVSRLFGFSAKTSPANVDQATQALLQANPQLQNISAVPVGAAITVPPSAPPLAPAQAAPASVVRSIAIAGLAKQTLDALNQRLTDIDTRASAAAAALLAGAQSKQAQTIAQNMPDLKAQLPALVSSLQTAASEIKASQSLRSQALSALQSKLG